MIHTRIRDRDVLTGDAARPNVVQRNRGHSEEADRALHLPARFLHERRAFISGEKLPLSQLDSARLEHRGLAIPGESRVGRDAGAI